MHSINIITEIDPLLNDSEINLLADLFLACFEFDRESRGYLYFRNAVVLMSRGVWDYPDAIKLLAEYAAVDVDTYKKELRNCIDGLKSPVHEIFNATYAPPPVEYECRPANVTMKQSTDLNYIISFLGTVFLYLIVTNYPKYGYIKYIPKNDK